MRQPSLLPDDMIAWFNMAGRENTSILQRAKAHVSHDKAATKLLDTLRDGIIDDMIDDPGGWEDSNKTMYLYERNQRLGER